jgi:sporulation protein YlmC with PRC-barrel domain
MKRLLVIAAATAATLGMAAPALAECNVMARADLTKELRNVDNSDTRNDITTLRNAAAILKRNDKEDACETVVEAMNDMRSTLRQRSADATSGDDTRTARAAATNAADTRQADRGDRREARVIDASRLRASKLMGADLVGPDGSEVAEIEDIVLNQSGENFVIVSFGGFLGMGDELAAVPLKRVKIVRDDDGEVQFSLPMTVEQLKTAPRFKKGSQAWFEDDSWWNKNNNYYTGLSDREG